jgi:cytosine/creatinine deaminase
MRPESIPANGTLVLSRARVPVALIDDAGHLAPDREGLACVDIAIGEGRIRSIAPSEGAVAGAVDLDHSQVWPAFVDLHAHLDKNHILPRSPNPEGTVPAAVQAVAADRIQHWTANDVRRRFEFALRCAYAHGTSAIRTHLDCEPPQAEITWQVFAELRDKWKGRIELQGVAKYPLELYSTPEGRNFAAYVAAMGGILGAVTRLPERSVSEHAGLLPGALDALFALAAQHDLDIDLHVDESGDPEATSLRQVALAKLRHNFPGTVVCGHCCSLATQPEAVAAETMDLCAESGVSIVTLPLINQHLQDRGAGRTPRWRGLTLVHELRNRGVTVAVAGDNCRDPFFAYGDHDMLEVFGQAVRIGHLDLPYGPWPETVTRVPADLMGLKSLGRLRVGEPADLVVFAGRTMSELLSRPQADRWVLRSGKPIDRRLPDFRELDSPGKQTP